MGVAQPRRAAANLRGARGFGGIAVQQESIRSLSLLRFLRLFAAILSGKSSGAAKASVWIAGRCTGFPPRFESKDPTEEKPPSLLEGRSCPRLTRSSECRQSVSQCFLKHPEMMGFE